MESREEILKSLGQQINSLPAYFRFVMFTDQVPANYDLSKTDPVDYTELPMHIPLSPLIQTENSAWVQNRMADFAVRLSPAVVGINNQDGFLGGRNLFSYTQNNDEVAQDIQYIEDVIEGVVTETKELDDISYLSFVWGLEPNHSYYRMNKLALIRLGDLSLRSGASIERVVEVVGSDEKTPRPNDGHAPAGER